MKICTTESILQAQVQCTSRQSCFDVNNINKLKWELWTLCVVHIDGPLIIPSLIFSFLTCETSIFD